MTDTPEPTPAAASAESTPAAAPVESTPAAGLPALAVEPAPVQSPSPSPADRFNELRVERPEAAVGAAFGGGLLLALVLKRLAR